MNLVQHQHRIRRLGVEKQLRILQRARRRGQIAVQVQRIGQHPGNRRFAHSPHTGQPDDRPLCPGLLNSLQPERAFDHVIILYV
jgi:hypothetical protein